MNINVIRWFDSDFENDPDEGILGLTIALVDLLQVILTKGSVWNAIKSGLKPLLMTISSYMLYSNE